MIRKRTRSVHNEEGEAVIVEPGAECNVESQVQGNSHKSNSFFNVAGFFWGLNPKNGSYNDSARSPKSPLDEVFLRSPGSPPRDGCQKSWNSGKVGLSIVDSLDSDDGRNASVKERILLSSDSKSTIVYGPKTKTEPGNSDTDIPSSETTLVLPGNFSFRRDRVKPPLHKGSSDVVFEIGDVPPESDSCVVVAHQPQLVEGIPRSSNLLFSSVALEDGFVGSLSANDIELSEDYTRVTAHGPNPKTIHIYGDCILESHSPDEKLSDFVKKFEEDIQATAKPPASHPCLDFLSACYACKKRLEEGKDIYIYRGEKAFCSVECRSKEILLDGEAVEITDGAGHILKQGP